MQSFVERQLRSVVPGIVLTLLAVGILVDVLVSKKLEKEFDQLLVAKSNGLIALTEDGTEGFEFEHYEDTLPNFTDIETPEYFELVNDAGESIKRSLSLTSDVRLFGNHASQSHRFLDIELPDGRAGRVLRTRFYPRAEIETVGDDDSVELPAILLNSLLQADDAPTMATIAGLAGVAGDEDFRRIPLTLHLASSRENLDNLIRSIHFLFLAAGLLTVGIILYLLQRGTNRALAPLNALADQVADIDERRLDQKLAVRQPVAELSLLTERFNFLLSRLQDAFAREQRFTGDMAHELRTPVSEIKCLVDVNRQWPDDPELQQTFFDDIDSATNRMQNTIENLLTLARTRQYSAELNRCDDLVALVADRVEVFGGQARERNLSFSLSLPSHAMPCLGHDQWVPIVDNLLCNAISHSKAASIVGVELQSASPGEDLNILEISNAVIDLTQNDLPLMFDRLWRKDLSRTSTQHSGLGLALVSTYAEQIDASIESKLDAGRLTIRILFGSIE